MEKLLPYNIEAESGVLGSILIDPDALSEIEKLIPEDFYRDAHITIYRTMLDLYEQQKPADFIILCDELEARGQLDAIGGGSYITSLVNQVPTSGNIAYYAAIVKRNSMLRQIIHASGQIAALAYNGEESALQQAEELLQAISSGLSGDFSPSSAVMNSYMTDLDVRHENRGKSALGIPTNSLDYDRITGGLHPSELTILAGRPSMGKTALALNWVRCAALKSQKSVAVFSLEMGKDQLAGRLLAQESGVDQSLLRSGWVDDNDWEKLVDASSKLSEGHIWIADEVNVPVQTMRAMCKRLKARHGLDLVVVDYLQLMESGNAKLAANRVSEVGEISRGLKKLAIELHVPVVALAQLSRSVENRQVKVPQLSDLRESGSIENDADVVSFIYRDEYYNKDSERRNIADIIIAKHRNGAIGEVSQFFNRSSGVFRDLEVTHA